MPEGDRWDAGENLRLFGRTLQTTASLRGWSIRTAFAAVTGPAIDQPQVSRSPELYTVAQ